MLFLFFLPALAVVGTIITGWPFLLFIGALYVVDLFFWSRPFYAIIMLPTFLAVPLGMAANAIPFRLLRVPFWVLAHLFGTTWIVFARTSIIVAITYAFATATRWPYMLAGAMVSIGISSPSLQDEMERPAAIDFLARAEALAIYVLGVIFVR
jgi:hypothetical protein